MTYMLGEEILGVGDSGFEIRSSLFSMRSFSCFVGGFLKTI